MTDAHDPQDIAEQIDEDVIAGDDTGPDSDRAEEDFPPDELHGVPFADADVTDESFAERTAQELPETSERDIDERDA